MWYALPVLRRLFNLAAVASAVLCAGVCVLWVRSYFVCDVWVRSVETNGVKNAWVSTDGRFGEAVVAELPNGVNRAILFTGGYYYIQWVVTFGALPFLRLLAWAIEREIRRRGPHACARCGYDLRASPGRCPECGTVPANHEAPADIPAE